MSKHNGRIIGVATSRGSAGTNRDRLLFDDNRDWLFLTKGRIPEPMHPDRFTIQHQRYDFNPLAPRIKA